MSIKTMTNGVLSIAGLLLVGTFAPTMFAQFECAGPERSPSSDPSDSSGARSRRTNVRGAES